MSERAERLAELFERAVGDLTRLLARCSVADWQKRCPDEERPVGVVAHHVASGLRAQIGWLQMVASGQPLPAITAETIDGLNASHAERHAHHTEEDTLATLDRNSSEASSVIRGLSDEQLDRRGWMPLFGDRPLSAEEVIRLVMVRHILVHTRSIRAALEA